MSKESQQEFINWVRQNQPFIFEIAKERANLLDQGLGNISDNVTGFFNNLVDTVKNVAPQYINFRQQKKLLDIQINRAKNNLPPLDADKFTPAIKIAPVITPETAEQAKEIARKSIAESFNANKLMLFGGGALLLFMLPRLMRGG